jgi:hypothetical protein
MRRSRFLRRQRHLHVFSMLTSKHGLSAADFEACVRRRLLQSIYLRLIIQTTHEECTMCDAFTVPLQNAETVDEEVYDCSMTFDRMLKLPV